MALKLPHLLKSSKTDLLSALPSFRSTEALFLSKFISFLLETSLAFHSALGGKRRSCLGCFGGRSSFSRCTNNNSINPPLPPFFIIFKNSKPEVKSVVSLALSNSKRYQSQEGTAGDFIVFLFFVICCGPKSA